MHAISPSCPFSVAFSGCTLCRMSLNACHFTLASSLSCFSLGAQMHQKSILSCFGNVVFIKFLSYVANILSCFGNVVFIKFLFFFSFLFLFLFEHTSETSHQMFAACASSQWHDHKCKAVCTTVVCCWPNRRCAVQNRNECVGCTCTRAHMPLGAGLSSTLCFDDVVHARSVVTQRTRS